MFPSELEFRGCSPGTFKSRDRRCGHLRRLRRTWGSDAVSDTPIPGARREVRAVPLPHFLWSGELRISKAKGISSMR